MPVWHKTAPTKDTLITELPCPDQKDELLKQGGQNGVMGNRNGYVIEEERELKKKEKKKKGGGGGIRKKSNVGRLKYAVSSNV